MRILLLLFLMHMVSSGKAQEVKAFYVGHSLSDQIPDMVKSLADDHQNANFDWVYQSIPGAPLRWQWQRKREDDYEPNPPYYYGFYDQDGGLPVGDFDVLVLTESVPRYGNLIEETYEYADSFFVYAKLYNPEIEVYLYEDWHCILSGTPTQCDYDVDSNPWRQRLEDDLPMWESVVDTLNNRFNPSDPVCLIPAAQGLAHVYDSIYAGAMPGLTSIEDIFSDNIHLNDVGKYFIACVHFSTIFGTSPVGLTNQLQVWWGGDFDPPSPDLALKFQEIAWKVSNEYPKSCIASPVNTFDLIKNENDLKFHPNPVNDILTIDNAGDTKSSKTLIFTIYGTQVFESDLKVLDVSSLSPGIYYLMQGKKVSKFVKK
ncbi:MAG: T9SS type A sorting domain-containing protein [Saprospiraceae bacterium]